MSLVDPARVALAAFRLIPRLPQVVSRGAMRVVAYFAWLAHGSGVRRLESNLRRTRPDATRGQLRRLARANMRNYLRYYAEAFILPRLSLAEIDARVRLVGAETPLAETASGRSVILALGHQGNWDLAAAWATAHLAPATTVAERLSPPELFEEFVRMRAALGVKVIPLDAGGEVFRELVRAVRAGPALVPLLADRDLTARGVEVEMLGERARVAAGPAALAIATGTMLVPTLLRHERLRGARRRAAGTPWGLVVTFCPPIPVVAGLPRSQQVLRVTQAWVDVLGADIAEHPTHWHMLQKVFVADLDPARQRVVRSAVGPT